MAHLLFKKLEILSKARIAFVILAFLVLSGCVEGNAKKLFNRNIDELNDFYYSNDNSPTNEVMVYKTDKSLEQKNKKATIKAKDISLRDLSALLEKTYQVNISYCNNKATQSIPENQELAKVDATKVDLFVQNVSLSELFEYLIVNLNIGVQKLQEGYVVYEPAIRTEIFSINYHNFYRKGMSSTSIASSGLKEGSKKDNFASVKSESEDEFWQNITNTIGVILNSNKKSDNSAETFSVYKESGLIVVSAYPKQLYYINKLLSKVGLNSIKQVLIEAKILEVQLKDEFNKGIQWDLLKKNLKYSSLASSVSNSEIHNNVLNTENNLINGTLSAKYSRDGFNAIMQSLSAQGELSVISSPRLLVLNNQRGLIKSGEDRHFITNVTNVFVDSNNNESGKSRSGFDLEPFFSGVALDTTPRILENDNILLHIHPMISRVDEEVKTITIDSKSTSLPVASIQSKEADTVVNASSGDIIILGGLTENYSEIKKSGMPVGTTGFISKLTGLFSASKSVTKKTELIILIKPTIISNFSSFGELATYNYN